jgi:hypothetical protein
MTAVERVSSMSFSGPAGGEATRAADRSRRRNPLTLVVTVVAIAGLGLRLWCARGPLTLDEIWSIENVAPLTRFWQVFWDISHDNNHFLNSLWLYFATRLGADVMILRAPSIAMGALTIAVMARLAARHSLAAGIAAAILTAASCFLVNYSVEARGYAGMALAIVVAYEALERASLRPNSSARFVFAAAAGIGALWHLAILPAIGLFALICLAEEKRRAGDWKPAIDATIRILAPTCLAIAPALACVATGVMVTGRFTIGGVRGFDAQGAAGAIADMIRNTIGLTAAAPMVLVLAGAALAIGAALFLGLVTNERRVAYAVILLALPAAVFILRPPNAHIARYYLICALFLILLIAEVFGSLWRTGVWRRAAALAALAAMLAGDVCLLAPFESLKDEGWPRALAEISASGEPVLGSSSDFRVGRFVRYYNLSHAPLDLVARADWCARRPRWFIAEVADKAEAPSDLDLSGGDCRVDFDFAGFYRAWGLSQPGWALYRAR